MEPKFNTSFIPKKSLQADVTGSKSSKYVGRRTVHGPGFYLMLLIFTITSIVSIGIFGYTKIVIRDIEGKINKMEEQKAAFDIDSVNMLTQFDLRVRSAKKLLMSHIAVSELFELLENITLKKVQYTELSYSGMPNETPSITISGDSNNFQNVALQTAEYRKNQSLLEPVVNSLEKKDTGYIHFSVDMTADERLTSFSSSLENKYLKEKTKPAIPDFAVDDTEVEIVNDTEASTTEQDNFFEDF